MGNTTKAAVVQQKNEAKAFKPKGIAQRHWNKFMFLLYGYMSCVGDSSSDTRRHWRREYNFNASERRRFEQLVHRLDVRVLEMIYNYFGSRVSTKREYGWRAKVEDTGMIFHTVKITKQTRKAPGYVYPSRVTGGYKAIVGINKSVTQIKRYEIRCVGVYESVDGKHGHGKQRTAGTIDIHLTANGNKWDKPLVLHLNSYEPVIWRIHASKRVIKKCTIEEIAVSSSYSAQSAVKLQGQLQCDNIVIEHDGYQGYGDDDGGGETMQMLANIMYEYGDRPLSMIGCYQASQIEVYVGNKF